MTPTGSDGHFRLSDRQGDAYSYPAYHRKSTQRYEDSLDGLGHTTTARRMTTCVLGTHNCPFPRSR